LRMAGSFCSMSSSPGSFTAHEAYRRILHDD
jgi:hypothetical protein